jgi:hypothetical protein
MGFLSPRGRNAKASSFAVLCALLCWRTKDFSSGNKLPSRPTLNALGEFSNRREYKKKRSLIGFY